LPEFTARTCAEDKNQLTAVPAVAQQNKEAI
jgi:hypothetical protein